MLIFSENFKQFVKFFNNNPKTAEEKTILLKIKSSVKILSDSKQKNINPKRQKIYEAKIPRK